MKKHLNIVREIEGFYRIIALNPLRRTAGVMFDTVPVEAFAHIDAIDRVIHLGGAVSPGPVGETAKPWYMHPHQEDNLIVLHGTRVVDLYATKHGQVETFTVSVDRIERNGEILHDGPAMLVWPTRVFHRIVSGDQGSASLNFAVHHSGFDIKTNFNIHDLDTKSGNVRVIREGFLDQPVM